LLLTFHSLNMSGIDLNDLDIDNFVINNRDFLDCSLEAMLQQNIENMSHHFGMHFLIELCKLIISNMRRVL
jgi:hypothetical protein